MELSEAIHAVPERSLGDKRMSTIPITVSSTSSPPQLESVSGQPVITANMVNELNIAGEFIYDGIDALNRMETIDEIPLSPVTIFTLYMLFCFWNKISSIQLEIEIVANVINI